MKTLVVDDDNIMRRILRRAAMSLGHEVTGCEDAESALDAYKSNKYPLIILDWMLPGMDGLEFCRKIRQMPNTDSCVVIMVTAKNKPEDLLAVLDAGADDYITKPVNLKLLKTRIKVAERIVQNLKKREKADREKDKLIARLTKEMEELKSKAS
jgi:DNA-binding response OmpR family regulator